MSMRVIAGSARGRRLTVAGESQTRPFLALARGALFNSLGPRIPGARVLDLYAGSGALGIEALSRGAERAVFVESDPASVEALRTNLAHCDLAARAEVQAKSVEAALPALTGEFDLVFVDPPYAASAAWEANASSRRIMEESGRAVRPGGILIFRQETNASTPARWGGLVLERAREYGRSRLCWYAATKEKGHGN
jgi:16S rRNA (guanine966-N2)-methyltransferase